MTLPPDITVEAGGALEACHALRRAVFIEEQGVTEHEEWDDQDADALHFLMRKNGVPVATARLVREGQSGQIGRICVAYPERGRGLGGALIEAALAHFRGQQGLTRVRLGAQTHAIPFYERLGFVVCGPVYDDAGIPHRAMERRL